MHFKYLCEIQASALIELSFSVVSQESREAHLSALVQEAQRRASELSTQVMRESLSLETSDKEKQLKAWEWRCKLYKRMRTGFEHARECFNHILLYK